MRITFLIALFGAMLFSNAQFGTNCEVRQLKINVISPGIAYEMSLGVNTTLHAGIGYAPSLDPFTETPTENYELFPTLTVQGRYYYNFESRARRARSIYGNSANYIAPSISLVEPGSRIIEGQVAEGIYGTAGVVTGLQRSYNSGLSFSIDVGGAYYLGPFRGGVYPVFNIGIGWIISEKRWCVGR